MTSPKPSEKKVADVLEEIADGNRKYGRCTVVVALEQLDESVRQAFEIALAADRNEFQHSAIARKLTSYSGMKVPNDAVARHRTHLAGLPGGCACGR